MIGQLPFLRRAQAAYLKAPVGARPSREEIIDSPRRLQAHEHDIWLVKLKLTCGLVIICGMIIIPWAMTSAFHWLSPPPGSAGGTICEFQDNDEDCAYPDLAVARMGGRVLKDHEGPPPSP